MTLPTTHTTAEVAASLRCNEWTIRQMVKRGVVTPMRIGDRVNAPMRFTDQDVERLVRALTPPAPSRPRRSRGRVA